TRRPTETCRLHGRSRRYPARATALTRPSPPSLRKNGESPVEPDGSSRCSLAQPSGRLPWGSARQGGTAGFGSSLTNRARPGATVSASNRYPTVPSQPNLPAIELDVLARWEREQTFQRSVDQRDAGVDGDNEFVFYDGP